MSRTDVAAPGRIVVFTDWSSPARTLPAIIIVANVSDWADLAVMTGDEQHPVRSEVAVYSEGGEPGTWRWPSRQAEHIHRRQPGDTVCRVCGAVPPVEGGAR